MVRLRYNVKDDNFQDFLFDWKDDKPYLLTHCQYKIKLNICFALARIHGIENSMLRIMFLISQQNTYITILNICSDCRPLYEINGALQALCR